MMPPDRTDANSALERELLIVTLSALYAYAHLPVTIRPFGDARRNANVGGQNRRHGNSRYVVRTTNARITGGTVRALPIIKFYLAMELYLARLFHTSGHPNDPTKAC